MRPQSEIRVCLAAALVDGPGNTRQLAQRTGWSIGATRTALDNMVRAGQVAKRRSRVPGVKRPVPVYVRVAGSSEPPVGYVSLVQAWMGATAWT